MNSYYGNSQLLRCCRPKWAAFLCTCALVLMMAGISSCSSLGLAPAKIFKDKLAYAHASHKSASELSLSALSSGVITLDRANSIRKELAKALVDLELVEIMNSEGQADTALAKLAGINAILLRLRAEMGAEK